MGLSQDRRRDKIEDGSMPALEREQKRWDGGKGEGELLLSRATPLQVITEQSHLDHLSLQKTRTKGKCFNKGVRVF